MWSSPGYLSPQLLAAARLFWKNLCHSHPCTVHIPLLSSSLSYWSNLAVLPHSDRVCSPLLLSLLKIHRRSTEFTILVLLNDTSKFHQKKSLNSFVLMVLNGTSSDTIVVLTSHCFGATIMQHYSSTTPLELKTLQALSLSLSRKKDEAKSQQRNKKSGENVLFYLWLLVNQFCI